MLTITKYTIAASQEAAEKHFDTYFRATRDGFDFEKDALYALGRMANFYNEKLDVYKVEIEITVNPKATKIEAE